MTKLRSILIGSLLAGLAAAVVAQPGPGRGPGAGMQGAGPAASMPGTGGGMGPGGRHGGMARMGRDNTPGWAMMTPQERNEHRERMRSMKSLDECKAYQAQHHEQMAARAKERGMQNLRGPRRDPCAGLK